MPKKRSPGDGGLYYDQNKRLWRGVVDVGFWPDGRRRQKEVTSRSQAKARQKLEQIKAEIRDHGAPLDRRTKLADWADRWLATVGRQTLKPNTLTAYESTAKNWIVPAIGHRPVAQLLPSDVRGMLQRVLDSGRGTATARKAHAVLSVMLDAARLEGLTGRNVAADVEPPKVRPIRERRALSTEEAFAVLHTAASAPDGTRWWMSILSGIRQGERLGATLDALDLDNGIFNVEWSLDEVTSDHGCGEPDGGVWPCGYKRGASCPQARLRVAADLEYHRLQGRLCLVRPKSGKPRAVPLVDAVVVALRRHVEATSHLPNPHGLIWRHPDGAPFTPKQDEQAWRDVVREAGIVDDVTSHTARHTTATVLMELGVDAKVVAEIVGHVNIETTRKHYQHVSSEAARAAAELVGSHFAGALDRF
ncbi:tyrosine-type recombinase/integrase [Agromyces sp. SYSU T00194]|uniref:tyrosine-type recombinase/integrase n=1 Tax=Agromyces chitinivorans TaxID=3158560 RepID=UPI0033998DB7